MDWTIVANIIIATVGGVFGAAGAIITARGQRATADTSGRAAEWEKLFATYEKVSGDRIEMMAETMDDLSHKVLELNADMDKLKSKLDDSIRLNRMLILLVPDPDGIDIPSSLVGDLYDG